MFRRKKQAKILSLIISLVMLLGTLTSFVYAENNLLGIAKKDLHKEASSKIVPELMQDLRREDLVEVMVYMADQLDTEMIARATRNALSSQMTPYSTMLEVRKGLVEALKDKAELTQANLLNYLEQEIDRGNVVEYAPYHIVNMVYVKATKEVIENISYMAEVETIYKNKTHYAEFPEVEKVDIGLESTDPRWNITRVGADAAWDMGYDGTGAVVGNLDSGVDWTHPALKNKWRGYDPSTGTTDPSKSWFDPVYSASLPADSDSHGTHVMGTMVGVEPDGSNPIGVAPGARWIAARVFNTAGSTTDRILLDAAQWMLAPGGDPSAAPDVVNNSWGGGNGIDSWYLGAVQAWRSAGIFPVFSAGNQRSGEPLPTPGTISVPSNYIESFAVAAVDINDIRASFSKLGPSPYDPSVIKPNISGPGVSIYSSIPGGYTGGYSGTSMSAPHVSGTVALLRGANASLTIEEMWDILQETADPLVDTTYPTAPNMGYGYGMVNAFEAVSRVATGTGYISGRVLGEGEDTDEPVIIHEQEVFEAYVGSDIEITAQIMDDVAITEVELLVKAEGKSYWMLVPMNRISGDYRDGIYKGTISHDMLLSDKMIYKIRVRDFAGEGVVTPDYRISLSFGIVPGDYKQGFESFPAGWLFDGDWEWGEASGVDPIPFEGKGLAGTKLDGTYSANSNSWMVTPPIDLRDVNIPTASLRFYHWYNMENNYDKGHVYITNDYGDTWHQVGPTYTNISNEWKEVYVGLDEFIGSADPVFLAWNLTSDGSVHRVGWYVDNVRIMGIDREAPALPTNLKAEASMAGIKLSWTPSPDADVDVYRIYRSESSGEGYVKIGETANSNFTDAEVEANTTYYYVIDAIDFSGNASAKTDEVFAVGAEVVVLFTSDFEDDNGGFTTGGTNNSWAWGIPTSGPNRAASGEKLWATNLAGNYSLSSDSYIDSPSIEIPEGKIPVITFNHWYDFEGTTTLWDYGELRVSKDDGASWENITPGGKYGTRLQQWKYEEILLDRSYGGETIKVRFFFHSDGSVAYQGWYVDDVNVFGINPPVIPDEEIIIYDDGTAENATVLNDAGNGVAVRFTPQTNARIKGTYIYLYDNTWPEPGGNRLGFAAYETHTDGTPRQVGETIYVNDLVRGDWNYIDLSSLNLVTGEDFYISTIQDTIGTNCPGAGIDEDNTVGRSYLNVAGEMQLRDKTGTLMIRADVEYIFDEDPEINKIKTNKTISKPVVASRGLYTMFKENAGKDEAARFNLKKNDLVGNYEIIADEEVQNIPMARAGIPATEAVVTILETGRSVKVDPATGQFNIRTPMGNYTLVAESYGYYDARESVTVEEDETSKVNFILEVKPRGSIEGRVVDRYWGNPASYATIRLVEDPRVAPVLADADGYFTIPEILVGSYTLKVTADGFMPGEFEDITVYPQDITEVELGLKAFVGYEEEIKYDDGTAENALVLNNAPNGLAVRFTPQQFGKVTKARVYFYDNSWPSPGGNRMGFAIYGTNENGTPYRVGEPIFIDGLIRGDWNEIDLSSFGFSTDRDFYISTIQDRAGTSCPGTGIDESANGDRSYMNLDGEFKLIGEEDVQGGLMIRAIIENSVDTPTITNLDKLSYTNQDAIIVEGMVGTDSKVNIYVNGHIATSIETEGLTFAVEVDLPLDENTIMVTAELDGRQTEPSPEVRVIKDKVAPVLVVESPEDNSKVNVEVIRVVGNASDNIELTKLLINEIKVEVDQDGNFNERIFVDPGENIIEIKALDSAGNVTIVERRVIVGQVDPEIRDMLPDEDMVYGQGSVIEVGFTSEPGGEAYFRVLMQYAPAGTVQTRIPMVEVEPGQYVGTWAVPEGFAIRNGVVEFEYTDVYGNRVVDAAPGRVTILGIPMGDLPSNTVIIGMEAFDMRYLDNNQYAQDLLRRWQEEGRTVYVKLNSTTIVNADGMLVDLEEVLPEMLEYYGIKGSIKVYEKLD